MPLGSGGAPGLVEPGRGTPGGGAAPGAGLDLRPRAGRNLNLRAYVERFKTDESLVYMRPDGVRYLLHAPPSRVMMGVEGFGVPVLNYVTDRAPFQNGDTVRAVTLGPRPMQLVTMQQFVNREEYWQGRQALIDALRVNRDSADFDYPGTLRYYYPVNQVRDIFVTPEAGPGFTLPAGGWRGLSFTETIRFIAHDPLWFDPHQRNATFRSTNTPAFQQTIGYLGDWQEQPSLLVIGPITNPVIRNITTGLVVALNYVLPAGRSMVIRLRGTRSATLDDGTNLLEFVTFDSDMTQWGLEPAPIAPAGVNVVQLDGTGSTGATQLFMWWYDRYLGI